MKKKILIVCMLAILLASIAAVSAELTDDHKDKGVTYNVPKGYTFQGSYPAHNSFYNSYSSNGIKYSYRNDSSILFDEINVYIYNLTNPSASIDDIRNDLPFTAKKTTINGVDGYLEEFGAATFYYVENGKLVKIEAPNSKIVKNMLSTGIFSIMNGIDIDLPNIDIPKII